MKHLILTILLVLIATSCAQAAPSSNAVVQRVIDGDTIVVSLNGADERVRLIGINAPERDECFGTEATEQLRVLLDHTQVTLQTDVDVYDDYGRLLAYVYSDDSLINRELVSGGFALAQPYPPNTLHQSELDDAMTTAKQQEVGLWAVGACGEAVGDVVTIESINENPPGPDEASLNDESITLIANDHVDLSGWVVRDGSSSNRYVVPDGITLYAGDRVILHSGCGNNSIHDLYWCSDTPIWNNDGDTVMIYDESGALVDAVTYPAD